MLPITFSSPARVDLSGGAADIFGLSTLSVAIDIRAYCTVKQNKQGTIVANIGKGEIPISKAYAPPYAILKHIVQHFSLNEAITIEIKTDIPMSSGLGGSASISVAVISALNKWNNWGLTRYHIAEHAQRVETIEMKLKNGYQDQYCSAFGKCVFMDFKNKENRDIGEEPYAIVEQLPVPYTIVVANTGIEHSSGDINAQTYNLYHKGDTNTIKNIMRLDTITRELRSALIDKDFSKTCDIISENQEIIKKFKQSLPENEKLIDVSMNSGAGAAKVTGAGCGGSIAALCETPDIAQNVASALRKHSQFVKICSVAEGVRYEV